VIDQVGGRLDHAARAAAGAETTALAAERDQVLEAAAITLDPQKAVLQQSALKVVFEFLANKLRQLAARAFDFLKEAGVMFGNDRIECRPFRPVTAVRGRKGKR
jgi:hypothetical protein